MGQLNKKLRHGDIILHVARNNFNNRETIIYLTATRLTQVNMKMCSHDGKQIMKPCGQFEGNVAICWSVIRVAVCHLHQFISFNQFNSIDI